MIGEKIRQIRENKNMKQKDVAKAAGMSIVMIGLIERGKTNPSLNTLKKIAAAMSTELLIDFKNIKL